VAKRAEYRGLLLVAVNTGKNGGRNVVKWGNCRYHRRQNRQGIYGNSQYGFFAMLASIFI